MKNKIASALIIVSILALVSSNTQERKFENSVIASAHPLASEAGIKMYEQGGNAADAAVAAAFTLAVVEPSMSGIGGRLQAIIKNGPQNTLGIDASTVVPISYTNNNNENEGYKTIGIPGVVAGLLKIHEQYGKLSLKTVMEPAIYYAEKGFVVLEGEAIRQKMTIPSLIQYKGSTALFMDSLKQTVKKGSVFIQKELAYTLKKIRDEKRDGFYKGEVALKIVKDIQSNGGYITLKDLEDYEVKESKILKSTYKGYDIETLYLPSYGAITINILNILDEFNLSTNNEYQDLLVTAQATKIAYSKRAYQHIPDSLSKIISKEEAIKSAKQIVKNAVKVKTADVANEPLAWNSKIGHTSHLTTTDKNGMVISLTQTIGPLMGSKVATKELGFLYAVTMGGYLGNYKPGDRANSHISPTLVSKNNQVILALGAAGGSRIVTAVTQVIKNKIDLELGLEEAVKKGRVYPNNDSIFVESHLGVALSEITLQKLNENKIAYRLDKSVATHGRINAVMLDTLKNRWLGISDPDWEGVAIEYIAIKIKKN
jgi:gamma-glutamyltranspeptidase/glutathione hydrolase